MSELIGALPGQFSTLHLDTSGIWCSQAAERTQNGAFFGGYHVDCHMNKAWVI